MKFFYNLERKFKRYAIPNLMYYIILMYGVGLLMEMFAPGFYWRFLSLDAQAILHGQIWRIVTFMIYPPGGGIFGSLISMYLYYMVGNTLERVWGAFRFNVYFFMGIIGHVAAALILYVFFGVSDNRILKLFPVFCLCCNISRSGISVVFRYSDQGEMAGSV